MNYRFVLTRLGATRPQEIFSQSAVVFPADVYYTGEYRTLAADVVDGSTLVLVFEISPHVYAFVGNINVPAATGEAHMPAAKLFPIGDDVGIPKIPVVVGGSRKDGTLTLLFEWRDGEGRQYERRQYRLEETDRGPRWVLRIGAEAHRAATRP
jgi:hypothetical protein